MARSLIFFVVGLAAGVGGVLLLADRPHEGTDLETQVRRLTEDKTQLTAEIGDLQRALDESRAERRSAEQRVAALQKARSGEPGAAPLEPTAVEPVPAEPAGVPTDDELKQGVMAFGSALQNVILGKGGEEALAKLKDLFARAGPEGVQKLIDMFKSEELGDGPRTVLAHALAQSGDPAALRALQDVIRDPESGMMDRRLASHGLAFSNDMSVVDSLRLAAKEDEDPGTRANSAFGLARRGDAEGLELYAKATDEAFERKDPMAIAYFQGLAILGKKGVPAIRSRLTVYKEPQLQIAMIGILRENKDAESIPALRALSADPTTNEDVRKAAEQALTELAK